LTQGGAHAVPPRLQDRPGDGMEVEVVQPNGGCALVVGKLDAVPEGKALRVRVCDARVQALTAKL
jgi:hypothetical protein